MDYPINLCNIMSSSSEIINILARFGVGILYDFIILLGGGTLFLIFGFGWMVSIHTPDTEKEADRVMNLLMAVIILTIIANTVWSLCDINYIERIFYIGYTR